MLILDKASSQPATLNDFKHFLKGRQNIEQQSMIVQLSKKLKIPPYARKFYKKTEKIPKDNATPIFIKESISICIYSSYIDKT